jgi:hypothetical protein
MEMEIVIRFLLTSRAFVLGLFLLIGATARPAAGQTSEPRAEPPAASPTVAAQPAADDAALDLAEPDFTVVNIPTTLRLPLHKGNFHLTHRFNGNLRCQGDGCLSNLASNLFGIDQGATIGFEYRFGIAPHLEAAAYRSSSDRTIQLYAKYDGIRQGATQLVSVSALVSVEGTNNFQDRFAPALGAVVSREIQNRVAVYADPIWVHNSAAAIGVDRDTFYIGLGGRVRVGASTYVVAEFSPRAAGYAPGDVEYGFGIEKRYGGHVFQLTFANTHGTTFGQLARGGTPESLYLGFNLSRKFF